MSGILKSGMQLQGLRKRGDIHGCDGPGGMGWAVCIDRRCKITTSSGVRLKLSALFLISLSYTYYTSSSYSVVTSQMGVVTCRPPDIQINHKGEQRRQTLSHGTASSRLSSTPLHLLGLREELYPQRASYSALPIPHSSAVSYLPCMQSGIYPEVWLLPSPLHLDANIR